VAIWGYWLSKELQDYKDTKERAAKRFLFDSADITWNVKTALLYFGIGGVLAAAALVFGLTGLIVGLLVVIYPAGRVAFWWLRRKLAFQQAGLPYLYRLTNFSGAISDDHVGLVSGLCNLKNRPIALWKVLIGREVFDAAAPPVCRHLLIAGPLRSGKTSL